MADAQKGQDLILSITLPDRTKTPVGYMRSKELSRSKDTVDTSSDENPKWATSIATQRSWGLSGAALYVYDDPGQVAVEDAYDQDAPATYTIEPREDGVGFAYEGSGHLVDASISASTNEVIEYSLEVEGTGPLQRTDVSTTSGS